MLDLVQDLVHNSVIMEINVHEAKTNFSELLRRVALGEEITIAKAGVPVAKLVPIIAETKKRELGLYRDQIWIAEDFDAPLPDDILAGFLGEEAEPAAAKKPVAAESRKPRKRKRKR